MQNPTDQTAIAPTAHQRRVRAIVKRLVIDLGYLEYCAEQGSIMPDLAIGASHIDAAIDAFNEYLEGISQKITPVATTGAETGNLTAVYPANPYAT